MYFGISPIAGTILAIILIVWLIGSGIKSAGKKLPDANSDFDEKYNEFMKNMGPMDWKEKVVSVLLILLFIFIVLCVSSLL